MWIAEIGEYGTWTPLCDCGVGVRCNEGGLLCHEVGGVVDGESRLARETSLLPCVVCVALSILCCCDLSVRLVTLICIAAASIDLRRTIVDSY